MPTILSQITPLLYITQTYLDNSKFVKYLLSENNEFRLIDLDIQNKKDLDEVLYTLYTNRTIKEMVYLGDVSQLSQNAQQSLLKFLEEPPHNLLVIISSQYHQDVIPTVLSRVKTVNMKYSQLSPLLDSARIDFSAKAFAPVKDTVNTLIFDTIHITNFGDLAKIERDQLEFYLWQVSLTFDIILKASYVGNKSVIEIDKVANCQQRVIESIQALRSNVQKKIALVPILKYD